ncbi:MAG: polysaccharide biosynthesis protein [Clostridiales bacterium]|nr:polysaccharide biosynthesis protein [Clostridiales bacterium]
MKNTHSIFSLSSHLLRNKLIQGTLILTIAGFLTRFMGFFYRIFLSNTIGAKNLGIYQLIFPVYSICFTIYAGGLQTAISKMVAEKKQGDNLGILKSGCSLSLFFSCILSFLVYRYHDFIATRFLQTPECGSLLCILSLIFPFCGIAACINGFYYGLKTPSVPAISQLLEQTVRITAVFLIAFLYTAIKKAPGLSAPVTCETAVIGICAGEIAGCLFNMCNLSRSKKDPYTKKRQYKKELLTFSIPLTANHLILNLLHSFESILIPVMLQKSGLSKHNALSIFGILTGMAMPFIQFPSAVTNAMAVLLLPAVSEANAGKDRAYLSKTISTTTMFTLFLGISFSIFFLLCGPMLGSVVFHSERAGLFLKQLAWLCPMIYLSTTLSSILNGLGKTHLTLMNTICGLLIQLAFIILLIPRKGVYGYLSGLLLSQLTTFLLHILSLFFTFRRLCARHG